MAITLYSYFRSSSSYRVRIALNLKGIAYQNKAVHLINNGGEQFSESFKKLNPSQKIPVLVHKNHTIAQSIAIIEYLDEVFPEKHLLPKEPFARAQVRQLSEIVNSDIQPLQNLRVLKYLVDENGLSEEKKLKWIRHWIADGFKAMEAILATTSKGQFCHGDSPTMADCLLVPQVYNAARFDLDMSQFPLIQKINDFCCALDAFIQAHPDNQPDTP